MRLNSTDKESLNLIKAKIEKDLSRHFPIPELADEAGMSANKLKSGFRILFGITIYQYLLKRRMQYAKELIEEDKKTLAQIASASGFKYLPNFITAYHKYFGVTPGNDRPG